MIIAIDGPSGVGKSTLAQEIAKENFFYYLNTGSFYRAYTLVFLEQKINIEDAEAMSSFIENNALSLRSNKLYINEKDTEGLLHNAYIDQNISKVASYVPLRNKVNAFIKSFESDKTINIVCEGRDMTTVVFPKAEVRIFLHASNHSRAERRFKQRSEGMSLEEIEEDLKRRDALDKANIVGALEYQEGSGVYFIDTSNLTYEEVKKEVFLYIDSKL